MMAVSACLAGERCRYDGATKPVAELVALVEQGEAVAVCPEVLGGLPTPRVPSERQGDCVVSAEGVDVTDAFRRGAERALARCLERGCTSAILKARSPSCGHGEIYDGSFTGTLVPGDGVFAELLLAEGFEVHTEEELPAALGARPSSPHAPEAATRNA